MSLQPLAWDVIVVGAGTAGIPAALFAARRGAKVLLVESSDKVGGTLALSTGSFSAAGSEVQAAAGIEDSSSRHLSDSLRISGGTSDVSMLKLWVDHAAANLD